MSSGYAIGALVTCVLVIATHLPLADATTYIFDKDGNNTTTGELVNEDII